MGVRVSCPIQGCEVPYILQVVWKNSFVYGLPLFHPLVNSRFRLLVKQQP